MLFQFAVLLFRQNLRRNSPTKNNNLIPKIKMGKNALDKRVHAMIIASTKKLKYSSLSISSPVLSNSSAYSKMLHANLLFLNFNLVPLIYLYRHFFLLL